MTPISRRTLIGRGVAGAATLGIPGSLVLAEAAVAQGETDETEALERLVELEQAAELAFSIAAEEGKVDAAAKSLFEELSSHAGDHATALSEALDQLLIDPPSDSSDPDDYESLDPFDPAAPEADLLTFLIDLELELVGAYGTEVADLDEADLVRTSAQIAASHAQALVALRVLAKDQGSPLTELPEPAATAPDSAAEEPEST